MFEQHSKAMGCTRTRKRCRRNLLISVSVGVAPLICSLIGSVSGFSSTGPVGNGGPSPTPTSNSDVISAMEEVTGEDQLTKNGVIRNGGIYPEGSSPVPQVKSAPSAQVASKAAREPRRAILNLKRFLGLGGNNAVSSTTEVLHTRRRRMNVLREGWKRGSGVGPSSTYLSSIGFNVTGADPEVPTERGQQQPQIVAAARDARESAQGIYDRIMDKGDSLFKLLYRKLVSKELREDIRTRRPYYASDWTDALKSSRKTIPAILFLYFACLAPAVSFGTIASQITNSAIGVVEFLLSCGVSGVVYSIFCGQPMAFLAPTGLTLAFISGLFRFCTLKNIPFFPIYSWVGLWTGLFMFSCGLAGSSRFIKYCTRFTDEIFNGLLSVNFIYEAVSSLRRNFVQADPLNLSMPFVALSMALATFLATLHVTAFQTSRYFNDKVRTVVKDFGPPGIIVAMTLLNLHPWFQKFAVPTLTVPPGFELAGGRKFLVPLTAIPPQWRVLCAFPALLLTSLFFMDQNISVRVVNNPENKLKKGEAYNLDMMALGVITGGLSLVGLPWMCGATVQSLNHLRAMTTTKFNEETEELEITEVTETRLTGFLIHAMIASTLLLLPLLSYLPIPVVSGVFLFLGRKLMTGNSFFRRIKDAFAESSRMATDHPIHLLGRRRMNYFTALQILCLAGLWQFKQCSAISIFFPSVIGFLMVLRSFVLPKIFSEEELAALGDPTPT